MLPMRCSPLFLSFFFLLFALALQKKSSISAHQSILSRLETDDLYPIELGWTADVASKFKDSLNHIEQTDAEHVWLLLRDTSTNLRLRRRFQSHIQKNLVHSENFFSKYQKNLLQLEANCLSATLREIGVGLARSLDKVDLASWVNAQEQIYRPSTSQKSSDMSERQNQMPAMRWVLDGVRQVCESSRMDESFEASDVTNGSDLLLKDEKALDTEIETILAPHHSIGSKYSEYPNFYSLYGSVRRLGISSSEVRTEKETADFGNPVYQKPTSRKKAYLDVLKAEEDMERKTLALEYAAHNLCPEETGDTTDVDEVLWPTRDTLRLIRVKLENYDGNIDSHHDIEGKPLNWSESYKKTILHEWEAEGQEICSNAIYLFSGDPTWRQTVSDGWWEPYRERFYLILPHLVALTGLLVFAYLQNFLLYSVTRKGRVLAISRIRHRNRTRYEAGGFRRRAAAANVPASAEEPGYEPEPEAEISSSERGTVKTSESKSSSSRGENSRSSSSDSEEEQQPSSSDSVEEQQPSPRSDSPKRWHQVLSPKSAPHLQSIYTWQRAEPQSDGGTALTLPPTPPRTPASWQHAGILRSETQSQMDRVPASGIVSSLIRSFSGSPKNQSPASSNSSSTLRHFNAPQPGSSGVSSSLQGSGLRHNLETRHNVVRSSPADSNEYSGIATRAPGNVRGPGVGRGDISKGRSKGKSNTQK